MRRSLILVALLAATAGADETAIVSEATSATAAPAPALWEVGAGIGAALTPDYPGASGTTTRALPLPVVIYRGDFFRLGDGSVASGRLFASERLELDVSLNGSFDAESDDVAERVGMPDLGFIAEIGPELEIRLDDLGDDDHRLKLELPVRAAVSLDDRDLRARGWVFSPQLEYERDFADDRFEWSVSLTSSFASEKLHDYFYAVEPEFATASRPAYDASGGYLRSSLGIGLQHRGAQSFAAIGVTWHHLGGHANAASPLLADRNDVTVAAVFVYRLWESKRRARR